MTIPESAVMDETRIELLQRMPIFGGIQADTLESLLGLCPIDEVRANEYFFRENDAADAMFVLETGKVAVLKSWKGGDHLLRTLERGDCFGEMALIDLSPRSASVQALEDCSGFEIFAASLFGLYEHDLEQFALIQMNLAREMSRRLRDAAQQLFEAKVAAKEFGGDYRWYLA